MELLLNEGQRVPQIPANNSSAAPQESRKWPADLAGPRICATAEVGQGKR